MEGGVCAMGQVFFRNIAGMARATRKNSSAYIVRFFGDFFLKKVTEEKK
jgi:hypothetical protein